MKFHPHNSRILIRPDPISNRSSGGIILLTPEKGLTHRTGIVVSMGKGMPTEKGDRWPMPNGERPDILPDVHGKRVHYFAAPGIITPIIIDGVEHHIVRDDNLDLYEDEEVATDSAITRTLLDSEPVAGAAG